MQAAVAMLAVKDWGLHVRLQGSSWAPERDILLYKY
jgi:hypothetical protein